MHGTANHLLWGDRMWLGRFLDDSCTVPAFGADMYADFSELAREREATDRTMLEWAGHVTPEWLAGALVYTSRVDGKTRELPRAVAAMHLFNHGTHHRGQLTTLIKQAGRDPGVTDLPWLPGVVRILEAPSGAGSPPDEKSPQGGESWGLPRALRRGGDPVRRTRG